MMKRWVLSAMLVTAAVACSTVVVLSPEEQADALSSAIDVPGGDRIPGPPPAENDDPDHILIRHLTAPALLQPGQAFVIHIQTDVDDPARISGLVLVVEDAPGYILVSDLPPIRPVARPEGTWWAIDLPASLGEPGGELSQSKFELSVALLDENEEAGNYYAWTVWAGDEGPQCPDDAACGTQTCGVDPVCATACGPGEGACGAGEVCDFYGSCVIPDSAEPGCDAACTADGLACGPHPTVADCDCPSTCAPDEPCEDNACVAAECTMAEQCEAHETCTMGACEPIDCTGEGTCPIGTSCDGDVCRPGCDPAQPPSCPIGSTCADDKTCVGTPCDAMTEGSCPYGAFCEPQSPGGATGLCVAHDCDLTDPAGDCPDGEACRLVVNLENPEIPGIAPAQCLPVGDTPTGGSCTSDPTDASHSCGASDVCWNPVDPTASTCFESCTGTSFNECATPGTACDPVVVGLIHVCAEVCDPVEGAGACTTPGLLCAPTRHANLDPPAPGFPAEGSTAFVCKAPDAAGTFGQYETCDGDLNCQPGLACVSEVEPGTCNDDGTCCLPYCETPADCPEPDWTCGAPLGYEGNPAASVCLPPPA